MNQHTANPHHLTTLEALETLYGQPMGAAVTKELDHISEHYGAMIKASPFCALASVGEEGLDCSPRGDAPGFVEVQDAKTLLIPDRRGNNRIDNLRNLIRDPRISLLFLIPGVAETLRVNGRAAISVEPELLERFIVNGQAPRSVIVVTVDRIYFQCAKAVVRSKLWDPATQIPRSALPSTGTMVEALSKGEIKAVEYDVLYPERIKQTLY